MKHISLLLITLLSFSAVSCKTKNYMVGSANDHCWCGHAARVPGGAWVKEKKHRKVVMEEQVVVQETRPMSSAKNPVRVQ